MTAIRLLMLFLLVASILPWSAAQAQEGGDHIDCLSAGRTDNQAGLMVSDVAVAPSWKFSLDKISAGTGNRGNENP